MQNMTGSTEVSCGESLSNMTPVTRKEYVFLFSCVILSLGIHSVFMFEGFGEHDAVCIAIATMLSYHNPENHKIGQVTPLYQLLLKGALSAGIDKADIPALMNYGNLVLGSLTLIPLYLLWRQLANPQTAAVACALYSFTPAFWFANLYGMPHLPAFFFLLWAAIAFRKALQCARPALFIGHSTLAAGLMYITLLFKVDVVMYAGLFMGLVVVCQAGSIRNCIAAVIVPLAALVFSFVFVKALSLTRPLTVEYTAQWHRDWPTDITALKSTIPVWSGGAVFFAGILFSGFYCLFKPSLRRYVVLSIAWAMPAALFWCLRWGNSIRHMMIVFSVLIFLLSLTLVHWCSSRRLLYSITLIGILLNYFLMPVEQYYVNKGGRLIETARSIQAYHNTIIKNGIDLSERALRRSNSCRKRVHSICPLGTACPL